MPCSHCRIDYRPVQTRAQVAYLPLWEVAGVLSKLAKYHQVRMGEMKHCASTSGAAQRSSASATPSWCLSRVPKRCRVYPKVVMSGGRPQGWRNRNTTASIVNFRGPCAPPQRRWLTVRSIQRAGRAARAGTSSSETRAISSSKKQDDAGLMRLWNQLYSMSCQLGHAEQQRIRISPRWEMANCSD
jgi:hypothetical protein